MASFIEFIAIRHSTYLACSKQMTENASESFNVHFCYVLFGLAYARFPFQTNELNQTINSVTTSEIIVYFSVNLKIS